MIDSPYHLLTAILLEQVSILIVIENNLVLSLSIAESHELWSSDILFT